MKLEIITTKMDTKQKQRVPHHLQYAISGKNFRLHMTTNKNLDPVSSNYADVCELRDFYNEKLEEFLDGFGNCTIEKYHTSYVYHLTETTFKSLFYEHYVAFLPEEDKGHLKTQRYMAYTSDFKMKLRIDDVHHINTKYDHLDVFEAHSSRFSIGDNGKKVNTPCYELRFKCEDGREFDLWKFDDLWKSSPQFAEFSLKRDRILTKKKMMVGFKEDANRKIGVINSLKLLISEGDVDGFSDLTDFALMDRIATTRLNLVVNAFDDITRLIKDKFGDEMSDSEYQQFINDLSAKVSDIRQKSNDAITKLKKEVKDAYATLPTKVD